MSEFSKPRKLSAEDGISDFRCGVAVVDDWLANHARKAEKQRTAVVYASFASHDELAGFYTLSAYSVDRNSPDPIPVLLLGMLGVDIRFQTRHLGSWLLQDAIAKAISVSEIIGARALMVEPATDKAAEFYARYGFRHIAGSTMMFIPLTRNSG